MRVAALITGGGTGGHVYPGLAILRALRQGNTGREPSGPFHPEAADAPRPAIRAREIVYLGSSRGLERTLVPPTGVRAFFVPMRPPGSARGLLLTCMAALRALVLVARERPRVTLATGGYVCVPAAVSSWLLRVPVVLFLPDVVPGKAVRALVPIARRVAVTNEDSLHYLSASRAVVTGYPLREPFLTADRAGGRERFQLPSDATVLGVFGGSLGARTINEALARILPDLLTRYHVLHVSGRDRFPEAQAHAEALPPALRARYHLHDYLDADAMADAMAASDLALARSGASLLGELPATSTPAVLVPLPIPGVHQRENAEYLAGHGAAVVLDDDRLHADLGDVLEVLLRDRERLEGMAQACRALFRPDAADRIADLMMEVAG